MIVTLGVENSATWNCILNPFHRLKIAVDVLTIIRDCFAWQVSNKCRLPGHFYGIATWCTNHWFFHIILLWLLKGNNLLKPIQSSIMPKQLVELTMATQNTEIALITRGKRRKTIFLTIDNGEISWCMDQRSCMIWRPIRS